MPDHQTLRSLRIYTIPLLILIVLQAVTVGVLLTRERSVAPVATVAPCPTRLADVARDCLPVTPLRLPV